MKQGKIKKINTHNYSGEIKTEGSGNIVSFDKKALQGDIKQFTEGAIVEFEEVTEFYRPTAKRVILIKPSDSIMPPTTSKNLTLKEKTPQSSHKPKETPIDKSKNRKSPYGFHKRRALVNKKYQNDLHRIEHISHSKLHENLYDIALEIEWQNLTPVAANPCSDPIVPSSPFDANSTDFAGYDKRWLMIDGKLAISPFTVKSAIANAFANIMGACYRVVSAIEKHPPKVEEGHYYYTGKYKRYRVAMDGSSKPGIITSITNNEDGSKTVTIQPVKEFYYDKPQLPNFIKQRGDRAYITTQKNRGFRPPIIEQLSPTGKPDEMVIYHGPYSDGMDARHNHRNHKHRFYLDNGQEVTGTIKTENFFTPNKLKEIVYMGDFNKQGKGQIWYENLNTLQVGDFVYFQKFNERVTNIGKNFQFKALFSIDDAIPSGYQACDNPDSLCPRCSLFGMTGSGIGDEHGGYRGRFKSATLTGKSKLTATTEVIQIPIDSGGRKEKVNVLVLQDESNKPFCRQYLLPIQGQPKPNKRDVNGYFEKSSGEIKGAKYYRHSECNIDALIKEIDSLQKLPGGELDYTHKLRNFAHVLTAQETFTGTVGAESCSLDEIAGLILILHSPIIKHGFKIGIGKAFGMGSVASRISKVWIRDRDYKWMPFESLDNFLATNKDIQSNIDTFKKVIATISNPLDTEDDRLKVPDITLQYPPPVQEINGSKRYYWDMFNKQR